MLISTSNVDNNSPKLAASLLTESLQEHLETLQSLLRSNLNDIEHSGQMICDALVAGKKILLCGNGGSAADAQHIAAELVGCYEKQRRSWPAIALTTDTSALTAVSNDLGYEQVFARQLAGLERARELGCQTIALTGSTSDPLGSMCDFTVAVPASRTSRVQEAHITIGHLWCEMVDQIE